MDTYLLVAILVGSYLVVGSAVGAWIGYRQRRPLVGAIAGLLGPFGWRWLQRSAGRDVVWCGCGRTTEWLPMPASAGSHPHLRCAHCGSILPEDGWSSPTYVLQVGESGPQLCATWRAGWFHLDGPVVVGEPTLPPRILRTFHAAVRRRVARTAWHAPRTLGPGDLHDALVETAIREPELRWVHPPSREAEQAIAQGRQQRGAAHA